ncbi:hypothetical protein FRC20_011878 [Serendipita sp. 405]|nr:hypothetical protein FRC16_007185 [Serendipita sp. 398]KAG8776175.1 hypothetical protein FRC15_012082 [Serendipita sp. 397]KAG8859183.1 hypothetical protein FRC20_011878 [Serendipita sp. 405]
MTTPRRPRVFMDIAVDGSPVGRVIFQLFADIVPKTSENFRALCTGERGKSLTSGQTLYYKNSIFHRVIPEFMIQGGDFTKKNGTGGESIYGAPFPDEDFSLPVDSAGLLVMANRGPHTNSSQFFITLAPAEHLNGKHVVFGKVVRGMEVVKAIEEIQTDAKDNPLKKVEVVGCGELEFKGQPGTTAAAAAAATTSRAAPSKRERSPSRSRSRSRSRSGSRSGDSSGSEVESDEEERARRERKRRRKEEKREAKRRRKEEKKLAKATARAGSADGSNAVDPPVMETEEEYDLRLEREEQERREAARLEAQKRQREISKMGKIDERTGIRYKGRGQMRFNDPEKYRSRP